MTTIDRTERTLSAPPRLRVTNPFFSTPLRLRTNHFFFAPSRLRVNHIKEAKA